MRIEGGALGSVDVDLLLDADGEEHVEVDVERDLGGGDGWVLAEVFGAEEALFFGGYGGEDYGVAWVDAGLGPGAGHLQEHGYAGAVVGGAVVDVVAGVVGDEAQVVVVGGVEDGLVVALNLAKLTFAIRDGDGGHSGDQTGKYRDDVGALEGADGAGYGGLEADGEFDGAEAGLGGGFEFFVEVEVA